MITLKNTLLIFIISTTLLSSNPGSLNNIQNTPSSNNQGIQVHITQELLTIDTHLVNNQIMLQNFYQQQQNRPLWLTNNWKIKGKKVMQLLDYIKKDLTLNYRGYLRQKAQKLTKELERRHSQKSLIQLEIQLTYLYYEFIQHTIYGEIDWNSFQTQLDNLKSSAIDANWVKYPLGFDLIRLMSQENISQTIQSITPNDYGYQRLSQALTQLYRVKWKKGWRKLPPFKSLKVENSGAIVQELRERLRGSGDYKWCKDSKNGTLFDSCLDKAVKRFQKRHGLTADGVVGKGTQKVLNISVDEKIKRVLLNMDRIKWLPRQSSKRYIVVNIPEYMLHYMQDQQEIKTLRVIVGDTKHPTPIFSNQISYITLNPYWKLPEGIVRREVVPEMIKNPNYIKKQGLEAHTTWEENSSIPSLKNINWSDYLADGEKFPYRLMQPPGAKNALGKIKFKFPNNFAVYLHDTPTKHLFNKKRRAFSHGCVRLSKPLSLLKSISHDPSIDLEEANSILKGKEKREINLEQKIPINLIYLTAWVNANGELTFGDDIYNYDKYQQRRLR